MNKQAKHKEKFVERNKKKGLKERKKKHNRDEERTPTILLHLAALPQ